MDRPVIQQRLAETEEQIANGENQIAQQRRLIAQLETDGSGFPCQIFASWVGVAANRSAGQPGVAPETARWPSREMTARRFPPPRPDIAFSGLFWLIAVTAMWSEMKATTQGGFYAFKLDHCGCRRIGLIVQPRRHAAGSRKAYFRIRRHL
jgi:hypothetical protein